jgi:hypothetical protein
LFALLLAEENQWQFTNAYRSVATFTSYRPLPSILNVMFKAE